MLLPTMGIGDYGSMTVAADPTGAVFGLWQSGTHTGVDLYSEPGALIWSEAMVADYEAGKDFYAEVFGYTYVPMGEGFDYSTAELDGQPVGGVGSVALMGEGVPSHWRTYFTTADIVASCAKVTELGGTVRSEPWDTPFGKMASVRGPDGEAFELNEPPAGPS